MSLNEVILIKSMSRTRYKIYGTEYPYLITSSIVYGLPVFSFPAISEIILNSFLYLQEKRDTSIYSYVIMENHIHFIAQSDLLAGNIRDFKSYTARKSINYLRENGHSIWLRKLEEQKASYKSDRSYQFWQEGYHPKQIIGDSMMIQKIGYIHSNPVKRGYVDKAEHWRYSSARNYIGDEGLIPITCI